MRISQLKPFLSKFNFFFLLVTSFLVITSFTNHSLLSESDFKPVTQLNISNGPTIGEISSNAPICSGIDTLFISVDSLTNMDSIYGIKLVYSDSLLFSDSLIYNLTSIIDSVSNLGLTNNSTTASFATFNYPNISGNYNVYAIVYPTPSDPSCRPYQQFQLTVNSTPSYSGHPDIAVCSGDSVPAIIFYDSLAIGATYTWTNSNPNLGIAASGTGDIPAFTPYTNTGDSTFIAVTPEINGCVGTTQYFSITVNPSPYYSGHPDIAVCSGDSVPAIIFYDSLAIGATYTWTNSNPNLGIAASGTGDIPAFTPYTNTGDSTFIAVTPEINGCVGTTQYFSITVNPSPYYSGHPNLSVCSGDSVPAIIFYDSLAIGATYTWTNSNPNLGIAASGTGDIPAFTPYTNTGDSTFIAVTPEINGCVGTTQYFSITVNPSPYYSGHPDIAVCSGDSVPAIIFYDSLAIGATYTWTNSNPNLGIAASGTGDIPAFTPYTNTGDSTFIAVTPEINGCVGTTQYFSITVNPSPYYSGHPDIAVCSGDSVPAIIFYDSLAIGANYTWTNSNPNIGISAGGMGNIQAFTPYTNTGDSAFITVTPELNGCVGPPQTFSIAVNPSPYYSGHPDIAVCSGDSVPAIIFYDSLAIGANYTWTNSNPNIGISAGGMGNIQAFTPYTNTGDSAFITVTPELNGCVGPPQTFSIAVNPSPYYSGHPNLSVCSGDSVSAIIFYDSLAIGANYTWTNSNPNIGISAGGMGNIQAFTPYTNTGDSAFITVTPELNGCVGPSQTFSIAVNPSPYYSGHPDIVVCSGDSVPAIIFYDSLAIGANYTWTNSNPNIGISAGGMGNIQAFTPYTNTGDSAFITVTPELNGCIGPSQTFSITVNPSPYYSGHPNLSVCSGDSVPAIIFYDSLAIGANYTWTNSNPNIGISAGGMGDIQAFTPYTNTGDSAFITVTPELNGCVGPSQTFSITVNPSPYYSGHPNLSVCSGDSVPAIIFYDSLAIGANYTWTNSNPNIGISAGGMGDIQAFTPYTNTGDSAFITVTPELNGCVGPSQTFSIAVNPSPYFSGHPNLSVCSGDSVPAIIFYDSLAIGANYTWTNSNPNIGISAGGMGDIPAFTPYTNTGDSAFITVTPELNGCIGPSQTFSITVSPSPYYSGHPNLSVCSGDSVPAIIFYDSLAIGANYTWTNSNPNIGISAGGMGNIQAFTPYTNTGDSAFITVTPELNGCIGPSQTFSIIVNPSPYYSGHPNLSVCSGDSVPAIIFYDSLAIGANYTWTNSNPNIGISAGGMGDIQAFTPYTNTGDSAFITVTPELNGCVGPSQTFSITVNPSPYYSGHPNLSVCSGDSVPAIIFYDSLAIGANYTWTNSNPNIGISAGGMGDIQAFTPYTNTGDSAFITVTPELNGCVGPSQTFSIAVNPSPYFSGHPNLSVCSGDSVPAIIFYDSLAIGANYTWTNSNPNIGISAGGMGDIQAFTPYTNTGDSAFITVTPELNGCVGPSQTFSIAVNPSPYFSGHPNLSVCSGDSVPAIIFYDSLAIGANYTWTNSNPNIGISAGGMGDIQAFTPYTNTGDSAFITVTPELNGCVGPSQTFSITVNPSPYYSGHPDIAVCSGDSVPAIIFYDSLAIGATYTWTNSNPNLGIAASGTGDISAFTPINNTGFKDSAFITVTPNVNGCVGIAQTFTIIVNSSPIVNVPNDILFSADTLTQLIDLVGINSTSVEWTNSNPLIGLEANGVDDIPPFYASNNSNGPITTVITFMASTETCIGTDATFNITIAPSTIDHPDTLEVPVVVTDSTVYFACTELMSETEIPTTFNVTFQSGNVIVLMPSFIAEAGSNFTAQITTECVPDPLQDSDTAFEFRKNNAIGNGDEQLGVDLSLTLYPNPTSGKALLEYTLDTTAEMEISLMDLAGKKLKTITAAQSRNKGKYTESLDLSNLKRGMYFVMLQQAGKMVTQKIIIME